MAFEGFGKSSGPMAPPTAQNPFANFPRFPPPSPSPPFSTSPSDVRPTQGKRKSFPFPDYNAQSHQGSPVFSPFVPSENPGSVRAPGTTQIHDVKTMRSPPSLSSTEDIIGGNEVRPTQGKRKSFPFPDYNAQSHQGPPVFSPFVRSENPGSVRAPGTTQIHDVKRMRAPPSLSSTENIIGGNYAALQYDGHSHNRQARSPPSLFPENLSADGKNLSSGHSKRLASFSPLLGAQSKPFSNFNKLQSERPIPSNSPSVVPYDSERRSPIKYDDVQILKRARSPNSSPRENFPVKSTYSPADFRSSSTSPPQLRANGATGDADYGNGPSSTAGAHINAKVAGPREPNYPVKRTKSPSFPSPSTIQDQDDMTRESLAKAKRLARFKEELSMHSESDPSTSTEKGASKREHQAFTAETAMDVSGVSNNNISSDFESLESTGVIVGSCPDMCPESERSERERKGDLDRYERVDGDRNQTSRYLAVKKYTRTAEREAVLIRPMPILKTTMDYLLDLLNQCYDDKFLALYNFLWDRMRAIRMDLRMQHIFDEGAISMLEQMIRLHIIAMHELCEYTKGEGFSEGFDAHLNIEQMNKTSVELFQLYDDHRKKGIVVPTEKEFRGYYALLKLDKHPGYKVEPAELSLDLAKMTPNMRQTTEVIFARKVARACRTGNFVAFFRLAQEASYLQACLMHAHFAKLRTQALAALHNGLQNNQGIPVSHVSRWLGMEEEDIDNLLEYYGFSIKEYEEPYMVKESAFLNVDIDYPVKRSKLVHGKKSSCVFEDVSAPPFTGIYPHEVKKVPQLLQGHKRKVIPLGVGESTDTARAKDDEMLDYEIAVSTNKPVRMEPMLNRTASKVESPRHYPTHSDGGTPAVKDSPRSQSPFGLRKKDFPFVHEMPMLKRTSSKLESPRHCPTLSEGGIPVAEDSPRRQSIVSPRMGSSPSEHDSPCLQPLSSSFVHFSHPPSRLENITKPKHDLPQNEILVIHKGETSDMEYEEDEKNCITTLTPSDSAMENPEAENMSIEDLVHDPSTETVEESEMNEAWESFYDEEVAEAKLKLILRLWRRRCSKLKELREQKQLAVSAAMSFLSLGPQIWQNGAETSSLNFDVDNFMSKRYEIQERFRSRLNVSDVVAAKLAQKNSDANCICWKMVLCSEEDLPYPYTLGQAEGAFSTVGSWLRSKLMMDKCNGYDDVEGLVVSSAGLSIWATWLPWQSDADITYCFSVVKDAKSGDLNETVAGANSVLFVVSECLSWDMQKNRLHQLVMSLPSDSHLPLLILCGSCEENISAATIIEGLHLNDVESRIRSFHIGYLKNSHSEQLPGFFSDEQLVEGLQWLASESPKQPDLRSIKTRDLVLSHLNPSLKGLAQVNPYRVGPDQCISTFNESLDQTIMEVTAAAEVNRSCWPCPELALVEKSRDEYRAIERYLPRMGWSSEANIASLVHALNDCKLPPFRDDVSWLYQGSELGHDIENQRSRLENCLINYYTESCQIIGTSLAEKEASIMLQKCAGLHVHNSIFYIIPDWVMIFQRLFNWRLASLSRGANSSAYILAHHDSNYTSRIIGITEVEISERCQMVRPTLDELVEVSRTLPVPKMHSLQPPEVSQPSPASYLRDGRTPAIINVVESTDSGDVADATSVKRDSKDFNGQERRGSDSVSVRASEEAGRLSDLLRECRIMQSKNDEKLALYF